MKTIDWKQSDGRRLRNIGLISTGVDLAWVILQSNFTITISKMIPYVINIDMPQSRLTTVRLRDKHIEKLNLQGVTTILLIDCFVAKDAINIGTATDVTIITHDKALAESRIKIQGSNAWTWFKTFDDYRSSLPVHMKPIPYADCIWPQVPCAPPSPLGSLTQKIDTDLKKLENKGAKWIFGLMWFNIFCVVLNVLIGNWITPPINILAGWYCYHTYKKMNGQFRFGKVWKTITSIKIESVDDTPKVEMVTEEDNSSDDILSYDD
jgi:hypothetical protein